MTCSSPTAGGEEILDLPPRSGTYYGDARSRRTIWRSSPGSGMYGPYLVDGLPATGQTAELNSPAEIAVDAAGDLFIADTYSSCIREVPREDSHAAWQGSDRRRHVHRRRRAPQGSWALDHVGRTRDALSGRE